MSIVVNRHVAAQCHSTHTFYSSAALAPTGTCASRRYDRVMSLALPCPTCSAFCTAPSVRPLSSIVPRLSSKRSSQCDSRGSTARSSSPARKRNGKRPVSWRLACGVSALQARSKLGRTAPAKATQQVQTMCRTGSTQCVAPCELGTRCDGAHAPTHPPGRSRTTASPRPPR